MLKAAVLTLVAAAAALGQSNGGEERFRDWSRVHELQPGQRLVVRPFKGMGSKAVATHVSSDAAGIVVRLRNDQELEISKERIRSVVRRKRMRHAVLIGAGAGFAVVAVLTLIAPDFSQPASALILGGGGAGLGALGGLAFRTTIVYRAPKPPRVRSDNSGSPPVGTRR